MIILDGTVLGLTNELFLSSPEILVVCAFAWTTVYAIERFTLTLFLSLFFFAATLCSVARVGP